MTSRRIDQMLSLIGAILILLSSYELFFSRKGSYEGATLGRVSALEKVVKIKRARALDWVDAFHDDLVTENQMIYTDELSEAEVEFTEGQKLTISANSLVKIRSRGNENELDVGKGTIRATLGGDKPFIVKLNGEDYELKGENADVEINLHGDVGQIGVVSGEVKLEKDGEVTPLDEKTALVIDGEKISTRTIAFTPLTPAKQSQLYTGAESYEVHFTWSGNSSGKLLIARSSDFSDTRTEIVSGSQFTKVLSPGHYYWKLESDEGSSLVSDFVIARETSPEILRPKNDEAIDVMVNESGEKSVRLEWEYPDAKAFLVEISEGQKVMTEETVQKSFSYSPAKDFAWRVKVNDPSRTQAIWSSWQNIRVKFHKFPEVPTNLYPDGVEYQTFTSKPEMVELSWSGPSGTEMEIVSPEKTEVLSPEGNSSLFQPKIMGLHKWRIRGKDKFGRVSLWSEFKEFTIVDMKGEINSEGIQRIQLKRPDQEVTFGWEKGSGTHVFELSTDKNFSTIISKKEISGSEMKMTVPKTGTYYWRSREYRKDGTLQVSEPRKVIIEPVPAPAKPEALPPMEVPLERTEAVTSFLDRFISSAFADDVFGIARITLPERENTKEYVLRIYRKGESSLLVEQRLSQPVFVWKKAVPGEYDFQYAVVDFFDRQSPFSDLSPLIVKEPRGPSRPLLISPIRLEEVREPRVAFRWGYADRAKKYSFVLSDTEDFKTKIHEQEVNTPGIVLDEKLPEGTYFWQVKAIDERGESTPSSVGRFIHIPPKEEVIATPDFPENWQLRNRAYVAWAPSSDTYKFKAGEQSGKIDGNAMMGLEAKGNVFKEKWIYSGEFLRQSGKVFKKETYSLMKLTFDAGWIIKSGKHTFSAGPAVGFGSGQSYSISNSAVKATGVSGAMYGGVLRSFHQLGPVWNAEGKISYLTGTLTEMELGGNVLRKIKSFYFVLGAGIVKREYSKNDGKQSSLKLNAGIGREF
jgi:hypothetical protein